MGEERAHGGSITKRVKTDRHQISSVSFQYLGLTICKRNLFKKNLFMRTPPTWHAGSMRTLNVYMRFVHGNLHFRPLQCESVPLCCSHTPFAWCDGGGGDTQEKLSTVRCVSMKKREEGSSYLSDYEYKRHLKNSPLSIVSTLTLLKISQLFFYAAVTAPDCKKSHAYHILSHESDLGWIFSHRLPFAVKL